MDCAHLPAIHPHSKLWGILASSREALARRGGGFTASSRLRRAPSAGGRTAPLPVAVRLGPWLTGVAVGQGSARLAVDSHGLMRGTPIDATDAFNRQVWRP
jgi:hypothetical protein